MKYLYSIILTLFLTSCVGDKTVWESSNYNTLPANSSQMSYTARTNNANDYIIEIKNLAKVYTVELHLEVTQGDLKTYLLIVVKGNAKNISNFDKALKDIEWRF